MALRMLSRPPVGGSTLPRSRAQRAMVVAGVLLLVGGLSVFGWVGWQMWGTNWVSARKQADGIEALERQWAQGENFAAVDGRRVTSVVRIPRFGNDYQVPLIEGVSDDDLAAGFGHFRESVRVGQPGNFALAGHRVTHGEPLRRMPELRAGDEVIVETRAATYTYVLDTAGAALEVPFTAVWVLDPLPTNPDGGVQPTQEADQKLLTLTTCAELFHTDQRLVAFGHLESRVPR